MTRVLAHRGLSFAHRADLRNYTSSFDFAISCVFVKQSSPLILMLPLCEASLLPRIRDKFAEFLKINSLNRLRILNEST